MNNHGKVRLARFYTRIPQQKQQQIIRDVFSIVSKRSDAVCNFVETNTSWSDKYRSHKNVKAALMDTESESKKEESKKDETVKQLKEDKILLEFFDSKLIYRHYATLFFIFVVDSSESELGKLTFFGFSIFIFYFLFIFIACV